MGPAALVISAVAGVAGTLASVSAQRKEASLRRKQQAVATRRSRRQAIRQAQITRAQAIATAQGAGALQSSGTTGGIGAISSQLGEQLGFSTQMSGLSRDIGSAASRASTFGSLGQLGFTAFSQLGGFEALGELAPNRAPTPTTSLGPTTRPNNRPSGGAQIPYTTYPFGGL